MTQTGIHREAHHEESTVKRTADITLVENSTRGKKPKIFPAQTVEITDVDDTVCQGVEGHTSKGRHPSKIRWFGGDAIELENITNVIIVGNSGEMLIDGELSAHYGAPRNFAGGVEFSVLRSD
jgi:hypothetical protein